jgi:adenylate kinase family enzyme
MERINVIGSAGSGKSTLAAALAARLGAATARDCGSPVVIELDALYWRPGWQPTPREEFRAVVEHALAGDRWIVCGNYSNARDIVWRCADTIIWLDYPLRLTFSRLFRRTWQRIVTQEELWGGNRESWQTQFLSRDSLLWYVLRTHRRRQRDIAALLAGGKYSHLMYFHLRQPQETEAWLRTVTACCPQPSVPESS